MAPRGGLSTVPSSGFHHGMRMEDIKGSYSLSKSQHSQRSYGSCQNLSSQEGITRTERAANVNQESSDLHLLHAEASPQVNISRTKSRSDDPTTESLNIPACDQEGNLPANCITQTAVSSKGANKEYCSDDSKRIVPFSDKITEKSVSPLYESGLSAVGSCDRSSSDSLDLIKPPSLSANDKNTHLHLNSSICETESICDLKTKEINEQKFNRDNKENTPEDKPLKTESQSLPHFLDKLDFISPIEYSSRNIKHLASPTEVIEPHESFNNTKYNSRNYKRRSNSFTPRSSFGLFQSLKYALSAASFSKNPSDSNKSTVPGENNKKSHTNRAPKQPSKGKQLKRADSESTPLFPEGRQPQKPPEEEEETTRTMTAKDDGGSRFFVYYLSCFATIGGLLFGYDTGIVSGAMLLIEDYFELTTIWKELIVSATVGAAAVFALIAGFVCDYLGRKFSIMLASVVFTIGAVVMGAAESKEVLLGGRIIVGAGIGFASMTVPVYIAEAAPSDIRGRLVSLNQLFITIGILVSSLVAGGFSSMKETGWRYMLGLAGVPGVIQFIGFLYLPESPRWLVTRGKEDKAREVLRKIRDKEDVEEELAEIKVAVEESKKESGFVLGRVLTTPHVRKALLIGCGLQLFQQLCGINTVIYYSGTILKMAGLPAQQAIWLVTIPFSINFLFTILGVWLVERLGRKKLLVSSFIGVTIALVVLAVGFQLSAEYSPAVDRNITEVYDNGTIVVDKCITKQYASCEECIEDDDCGFCYTGSGGSTGGTCLRADKKGEKEDERSAYGRCDVTNLKILGTHWAHGYCPTDYTWMAVLGLTLFVMAFAPGLGPMPWTINSEIYPLWARSTNNAIATGCNWIGNLLVSLFFLTLTETITKYGAFWLFCGICFLGMVFTIIFVPETKNKTLEENEQLFMSKKANSVGAANGGYDKEMEPPAVATPEPRVATHF